MFKRLNEEIGRSDEVERFPAQNGAGTQAQQPPENVTPNNQAENKSPLAKGDPDKPVPVEIRYPAPDPLQLLQTVAVPLIQPLATVGIVVVFVIFMLLRREDL
ncbi:hypothetical protein NZA98_26965, partial [Escherichia coli]|nr:hypothetical protein [Escherichia coli]